jgi:hypothetical protein
MPETNRVQQRRLGVVAGPIALIRVTQQGTEEFHGAVNKPRIAVVLGFGSPRDVR